MNTINIKSIYFIVVAFLLCNANELSAQKDGKALEILKAMTAEYDKTDGVEITFGGSTDGRILLKGNMFHLDCDGIKTWFDGVTQWSFIQESNEVNISTPTEEELNMVNPYALIRMYEHGYKYQYLGTRQRNGVMCEEIKLIPETEQNFKSITVSINMKMEPIYIEFAYSEEEKETISVKKYSHKKGLTEDDFRFDMDAHQDIEIIDLR